MQYVFLEMFVNRANLFKFFCNWLVKEEKKCKKKCKGLEFPPSCLLDMVSFTLKPSLLVELIPHGDPDPFTLGL